VKRIFLAIILLLAFSCATGEVINTPKKEYTINKVYQVIVEKITHGEDSYSTKPSQSGRYTRYTPKDNKVFSTVDIRTSFIVGPNSPRRPDIELFYYSADSEIFDFTAPQLNENLTREFSFMMDGGTDIVTQMIGRLEDGREINDYSRYLFTLPKDSILLALVFDRSDTIDLIENDSPLYIGFKEALNRVKYSQEIFNNLPILSYEILQEFANEQNIDLLALKDSRNFSLYERAMMYGNLSVVKGLIADLPIEKEFAVSAGGGERMTEINVAVASGNVELVKWMLDNGYDMNRSLEESDLNSSNLKVTIDLKNLEMLKFIVDSGINDLSTETISVGWSKVTILDYAKSRATAEIVKYIQDQLEKTDD
jgi:hypothetical protein